jgi:hypothetical protein
MTFEELAPGWEVWNEEERRVILAYRPDVFDSDSFPPPCMPTIYVTKGKRSRRPGSHRPVPDDPWYVTLFLEPDVERDADTFDSREAATRGAVELANRFASGDLDYRALYQVPRDAYLERLDDLTERA